MKSSLLAGVGLLALLASGDPVFATQDPRPGADDPRVGTFIYKENDVFRIWSVVGATFLVKLNDGETIDAVTGADVCAPDAKDLSNCGIRTELRFNWLHLKFLRCLIPENLLMVTKTAAGKMRMYNFEVHTEPMVCDTSAPPPSKPKNFELISSANAGQTEPGIGNIPFIKANAMTRQAERPIFYSAAFHYPGDEAEKRKEGAAERRERAKKERADYLLSREVDFSTFHPRSGIDNTNYKARGSNELRPRNVWDSEDSTKMTFPGMQEAPVLLKVVAPDGYECRDNESAPDGEQEAQYVARRDTLIITGTAKVWRLRGDNGRVLDICNLSYNPYGGTTGTGTLSPDVVRVFKGAR